MNKSVKYLKVHSRRNLAATPLGPNTIATAAAIIIALAITRILTNFNAVDRITIADVRDRLIRLILIERLVCLRSCICRCQG